MKKIFNITFLTIAASASHLAIQPSLEAAIHHNVHTLSPEEYFLIGKEAFEGKQWRRALKYLGMAIQRAPQTTFALESYYYRGIAYYNLDELDHANRSFDAYLRSQTNPRYFQEALLYKFEIAERYRGGAARRCFGMKSLPKWGSGTETAFEIYDELAAALPTDDLGAKALFYKGCLLRQIGEYDEAVGAFQTVIRRFPKHELAPESYLFINATYMDQSRKLHNLDLITFAEMNLNRFRLAYPRDDRIQKVEEGILHIKEQHARGFFEMGRFYERIHQPGASVIYYRKALHDFPETHIAELCRSRLSCLSPAALEEVSLNNEHVEEALQGLEDISFE